MMAAPNPDTARITTAMWRLWTDFDAFHPDVQLGGIYARKSGYHNARNMLPSWDYSREYPADLKGPGDKAAAIDLTFPEAHGGDYRNMRLYTARLDAAARAKDPRLYRPDGTPVLREFIGTLDGRQTYAYDLQRRRSDNDRDDSHMWHIHLSVTRQFVDDWDVLAGVLSVLTDGDIEGDDVIGLKRGDSGERVKGLQACLTRAGFPVEVDGDYGEKTAAAVLAMRKSDGSTVTNGDNITGWAYGQLMAVLARKQGTGERGPAGPAGPQGPPGTPAKLPAKLVITGTVSAA